jgi:AbrB family looped-hinge helix DNA binding protein
MRSTINSKCQVTIPKTVRDLLGIGPGSKVEFQCAQDGVVTLVRVDGFPKAPDISRLRGHAGPGLTTDEIMALMRGT